LHPVYTPTAADLLNGSVVLTLIAEPLYGCTGSTDQMILTVHKSLVSNAGPDDKTCMGEPYKVTGAVVAGNQSILWTHNGTGTLQNAGTLTPTYLPGTGETGTVTLTLTVTGFASCGTARDEMVLTIQPAVTATAGIDLSTCETTPIAISGASAANYTSILWTTTGSGTFSNASAVNPVYTPSSADVNIGMVSLTMRAKANAPCSDVTDQLSLTLVKGAVANAGADAVSCYGVPYTISGALASNFSSVSWTFTPANAGMLTGGNTLTPVFTPAKGFSGPVVLTLSVTGNSACGNIATTDQVVLTIGGNLTVNAGPDQTIPKGSAVSLQGTVTGGSGFFAWSWEPAALLNNPNLYNPVSVLLYTETTFILKVLDMNTGCIGTDTVKVMMGPAIPPPLANPDYTETPMNTPRTFTVLHNDTIQAGTRVSVSYCSPAGHGTIVLNPDNTYTYTPNQDYIGMDEFCYTLCDNSSPEQCDTALVKITVFERNIDAIDPTGAITPNGDGYNDVWIIREIEYFPDNQVLIFNRWGDKIREYAGYDNKERAWDGTNEDFKPIPDGTYYYIIRVNNLGAKTGWILVRGNIK
jgi:gliding motility-associated-like protein